MKPGYQTTEFWLVVVTSVVSIVVATGHMTPEQGEQVKGSSGQIINAIFQLVGILGPLVIVPFYVNSRGKVKAENVKAESLKTEINLLQKK